MCFVRSQAAALAAMFLLALATAVPAQAQLLKPHKDRLFAYPQMLATSAGGRHVTVDYREERDIDRRDQVPERRVWGKYVDLSVRRDQQDLVARTEAGLIPHMAVGASDNARFIVAYIHGQGGNRAQGMNDYSFGGNFNRIKNLAADNGGLYLTLDFSSFDQTGAQQVADLLGLYMEKSPRARVYVACGSMGGAICWQLADDPQIVPRLGGLLLLGSMWHDGFLQSAAFRARVPLFFGHGSEDTVFPVEQQEAFFRRILDAAPDYPARFVRFETGTHGTPIRMTDWRDTLNWMHAVD